MCPLLWCRMSFKDLASVLDHVSSCPWLSDAWYWCPFCCLPERFTTVKAPSKETPHSTNVGKQTKFKRAAVAFFQTLGLKQGRLRSLSTPAVGSSLEHLDNNTDIHVVDPPYELDDTLYNPMAPMELDGGGIYELGGELQCITPSSSTTKYTNDTLSTPHSWQGANQVAPPPYSPSSIRGESFAAGTDDQPRQNRGSVVHPLGNHALITPVSLIRDSPVLDENLTGHSLVHLWQPKLPKTKPSASQSVSHPLENQQPRISSISNSDLPPVHEAQISSAKQEPATAQEQLGDLHEAMRAMSEEWIRRLAASIDITPPCSESYTCALVEIGFRTLRDYFRGTIPNSFPDIFALMHVAGASAYIIDQNDGIYSWSAFLAETHQWQHLLSDGIERTTFMKAVSRLCYPQGHKPYSQLQSNSIDNGFLPNESAVLLSMLSSLPCSSVDAALQEPDHKCLDPLMKVCTQTSLYESIRKSAAIEACTSFLDSKSAFKSPHLYTDLGLSI